MMTWGWCSFHASSDYIACNRKGPMSGWGGKLTDGLLLIFRLKR